MSTVAFIGREAVIPTTPPGEIRIKPVGGGEAFFFTRRFEHSPGIDSMTIPREALEEVLRMWTP